MIGKEELERLRKEYPSGTKVVLDRMDDVQAPPAGTKGTVRMVDDMGTIHVNWDNGSSLGLVYGVDGFHKDRADMITDIMDGMHKDEDEEHAKTVLNAVARAQKDGVRCPRCGMPMEGKLHRNALSRRMNIYICEICGTEEAFEDRGWNKRKPFSEWKAARVAREAIENAGKAVFGG